MITNESGTNIVEVASGIYRINTPIPIPGAGKFNFNQYLVVDEAPLLFHTGQHALFPLVQEAVEAVLPVSRLRYVAFSHFEADECGALNDFLAAAPNAEPVCSGIAAMTSISDFAVRAPHALEDGEELSLGTKTIRWLDTPHLPHGWESGLIFETTTKTLFCGDLFTQGGAGKVAITDGDILGPSEAFRKPMDYYSHSPQTGAMLERLAALSPATLACMHGSAWRGDGGALLRGLAGALGG
jgi:flavorubredoxin